MSKIYVEKIRNKYIPGTKVELLEDMKEEKGMPKGLCGAVDFVDDIGSIHTTWSNGWILAIIPGLDSFKKYKSR